MNRSKWRTKIALGKTPAGSEFETDKYGCVYVEITDTWTPRLNPELDPQLFERIRNTREVITLREVRKVEKGAQILAGEWYRSLENQPLFRTFGDFLTSSSGTVFHEYTTQEEIEEDD